MIPYAGLGAAGGFGLSEMAGGLFSALDAPRRFAWKNLLGVETGDELMGQMGLDTENPLIKALGMGSEMLLDPLNLVGAGIGARAGKIAAGAADIGAARKALGAERAAIESSMIPKAAEAVSDVSNAAPMSHANVGYHPAIMKELEHGSLAQGRTYNRVNPEMARQVDEMGIGYSLPQGGVHFPQGKPSFVAGKGGVLGQSRPMPWRAGFDSQLVDDLGNPVRIPDTLEGLAAQFARPAQLPPMMAPDRSAELAEIMARQQAMGSPGILESLLGRMGAF
jgi:hypothetical protein